MHKGAGPSRVWVPSQVMIAVDGSHQAWSAFEWYLDWFHQAGNTLILAHVGEHHHLEEKEGHEHTAPAKVEVTQDLTELKKPYNDRLEEIGAPYSWHTWEGEEKPGPSLCHIAEHQEVEYIVMGMRGLGAIRRLVLGSVSHHVLHFAHCPVIIHRDNSVNKGHEHTAFAKVEVTQDLTKLKKPYNDRLEEIGAPYSWHTWGGEEKPGPSLCHIAEYQEAEYIAMGMHGLGELQCLVIGSFSHHVLNFAHCHFIIHRDNSVNK